MTAAWTSPARRAWRGVRRAWLAWGTRLTLRARLTLLAAVAVAAAVALTSAASYLVARAQLRQQFDEAVVEQAQDFAGDPLAAPAEITRRELGLPSSVPVYSFQLVDAAGRRFTPRYQETAFPATGTDVAVAKGDHAATLRDVRVNGVSYRLATVPADRPGVAAQVARPLTELNATMGRLALILGLFSAFGVLVAVTLGAVVARAGLAPVDRLTAAVEHVARTQDLRVPIEAGGDDEVGRLARSFNAMLAALEESRARQRRLVTDAGHELRTPLTSLRTNIELLARAAARPERPLPDADRARLLADLTAQVEELGVLVGDVVDLARDEAVEEEPQELDLADVAAHAVERARRRAPGVRFATSLEPWVVEGRPAAIERAVTNLLDNAAKWSPPGGQVEVALRGGELTVADEGPGIAEEDLPRVFDRFYRAPAARNLPGSGLGLAIVRQVATAHAGTVTAERNEHGGATFRLRLPAG